MCNLYKSPPHAEMIARMMTARDKTGNEAWPDLTYPDRLAPILRMGDDGPEITKARWGMPSPPSVLKTARDPGLTNVRNLSSSHWRRWLGRDHRCLVPLTSFAEPRGKGRDNNQWFAMADNGPAFFAGIEVRGWKSVRKIKDGETKDDLFAFLTCKPNAEVAAVHPKAMPVILTTPEQWSNWLGGIPATEMQRPLLDGALRLLDQAS